MENTVRRYHVRSFDSYDNDTDLVQSYRKFLYRNDLMEAYEEKFDEEDISGEIRKVLQWNLDHDKLIIKDKHVEAWARDNDVEMVNEL
jgi:hypothetical protein